MMTSDLRYKAGSETQALPLFSQVVDAADILEPEVPGMLGPVLGHSEMETNTPF